MKVTFPMPMYKTTADQVTYRELRQVLNKGVTYARSHFDQAKEELDAVQSAQLGAVKIGVVSKTSTVSQIKAAGELTRAIQCVAVASQRLYLTLTLKRALNRFYNVLERLEKKFGERTVKITKALDFSMRGQHQPNFLATITVLEWGYRNQLGESGEYAEFPEAAILQLSQSLPPHSADMWYASAESMVQLESGEVIPVSQLPEDAKVVGTVVLLVKDDNPHGSESAIKGERTPVRRKSVP